MIANEETDDKWIVGMVVWNDNETKMASFRLDGVVRDHS